MAGLTIQECFETARKFKSRKEFELVAPVAFHYAQRHRLMSEVCSHMPKLGNRMFRYIYGIFLGKTVYIGLAMNPRKRFVEHKREGRKEVRDLIKSGAIMVILEDLLPVEKAAIREGEMLDWFKAKGFEVLNKAQTGGVGGTPFIWTKEAILEKALECKTRKEFHNKHSGAYAAASRYNIVEEVLAHLPKAHWNKEKVCQIAKKYDNVFDFKRLQRRKESWNIFRRNQGHEKKKTSKSKMDRTNNQRGGFEI